MASVNKVKVETDIYDISPSPSGTLDTTTANNKFESSDVAQGSATSWTNVDPLAATETNKSIFTKITQMIKNVRFLYNIIGSGFTTSNTIKKAIDGKAASNHTHNSVKDAGNNSSDVTFAYSKAGIDYGNYNWLAGWNGYELRAVNKGQFATASHTHTKSQITDFPSSLKNPTSLTIQGGGSTLATYDGSAAKSVNITKSNIGLGNVDNTADTNKSVKFARETYIDQYKTVNLTDLDQNTWYPVTGTNVSYNGLRHLKCNVQLNSGSKPSWSTHNSGFTAVVDILEEAYGWGTTSKKGIVLCNDQMFINDSNKPPVGYEQMGNSSIPVWWLRGGGIYFLAADYDCTWTIRKSKYEASSQSVEPKTTYPGVNISKSTIVANLDGTASYATNAGSANGVTPEWSGSVDLDSSSWLAAWSSDGKKIKAMSTGNFATAGHTHSSVDGVKDYNDANKTIKIGFAGAGLNTSNLNYIAGYTENGTKIKDVSKDVLKQWLGATSATVDGTTVVFG